LFLDAIILLLSRMTKGIANKKRRWAIFQGLK